MARSPNAAVRTERVAAAIARWQRVSFRVALRLNANFGDETAKQWRDYSGGLRRFLFTCELVASDTGPRTYWTALAWNRAERRSYLVEDLKVLFEDPSPRNPLREAGEEGYWARRYANDLVSNQPANREYALQVITDYLLTLAEDVTDAVLAAHPPGFSTTRGDMLHDLLP